MFKKKDNHNIPKDYDKTLNVNNKSSGSIVTLSGDGHKNKPKKWPRTNFKSKKVIVVCGVLLLVSGIATASYLYFTNDTKEPNDADREAYISEINETNAKVESEMRNVASQPAPTTNANNELRDYYSKVLWVKLNDGDQQGAAELYVIDIKPKNIVFSTDINEALVMALLNSSYSVEAKPLISAILIDYNNSEFKNDPVLGENVAKKIEYYSELEKNL